MSDVTMTQRTAKALIAQFTGQANILTIPRVFVSMTGSLEAALFLSQCLYWGERTADPDGWFWKRAEHWQEELSLSEYQVRKARKILAPFGLETDLRTVNNTPTLFYRVDGDQLYKCILQFLQNASCENGEMHPAKTAGSTYTEITDKDHKAEREIAPAPVTGDIPLVAPVAVRDMTIPPGTMITRRPDAPKLRAVPKFAQTPEFAATLAELLRVWPLRDGAGPNRKLTERALVLVDPREYPAVLAGAKRYAASRDVREGVIKNCHAWLADEDWTRYTVAAARPKPAGNPQLAELERRRAAAQVRGVS